MQRSQNSRLDSYFEAPTTEQKIACLFACASGIYKIAKNTNSPDKLLGLQRTFVSECAKRYPGFYNKEGLNWLITVFLSMTNSIASDHAFNDWFAAQLKEYDIQLLNVGYDDRGRCFNQAFGLLNGHPESIFSELTCTAGDLGLLDESVFDVMTDDFIEKNCDKEISLGQCQVGDLVFYVNDRNYKHMSIVIALVNDRVYLLSKPGGNPSMIHPHNVAQFYGTMNFYRTNDSAKNSDSLRHAAKSALDILRPRLTRNVSGLFDRTQPPVLDETESSFNKEHTKKPPY